MKKLPVPVEAFIARIRERFPKARVSTDAPFEPHGAWFLDISMGGKVIFAQWQIELGFTITVNPGLSPKQAAQEIHPDLESAFARVATLLPVTSSDPATTSSDPAAKSSDPAAPGALDLRELRLLRGVSQAQLAKALKIQQASVSRLERRSEKMLLSTLKSVLAALGGELKLTAVFPHEEERELRIE